MTSIWFYYFWAALLFLGNVVGWSSNLIGLPGNWGVVLCSALFAWFYPAADGPPGLRWLVVGLALLLAIFGEVIEFLASAAGAAKQGASRRSVAMSVAGAVVGGCAGLVVGLPIPLIGSAVAAVVGGALGAFAGAYLGEEWKGRDAGHRFRVARGAFTGRLWGTTGKLAVGAIMVVVITLDSLF
jgi:hypothetical protein